MAYKYLRDPIHGEIAIPDELLPVLDHPLFQRLRRISQVSLASYVYPSATHSRFAHSLGVYYITAHATDDLPTHAYALLHDVGHGPFSHLVEYALERNGHHFDHDERMKLLLPQILQDTVLTPREVLSAPLAPLVHGGVGTDRLDYLSRDSYFAGVRVGEIAWDRIVRNVSVADGNLLVRYKVLPNVEHLFVSRFILGDAVYFHKTVLILDEMFVRAVAELLEHYSPDELVVMDDPALISAFRSVGSVWWQRIEQRTVFHIVSRHADVDSAERDYERWVDKLGEDHVILGKRASWYKPPEVRMEDGQDILEVSPLVASLRAAEDRRMFYFVAVSKS
ncbi:MAG: HD domain-containing protein [Candidatus Diapherotrites archaeon]|nr:HD domain-containing protein [Candidatus Diapherotrites archaeon]